MILQIIITDLPWRDSQGEQTEHLPQDPAAVVWGYCLLMDQIVQRIIAIK
jgi:hypothetical protein